MVMIPARIGGTLSLWWMSEVTRPARAPAAKPPIRASTGKEPSTVKSGKSRIRKLIKSPRAMIP